MRNYVSIEPIKGYLVRYHPSGKGFGSPYTFSVVVAEEKDGLWFKGAKTWTGHYSTVISRAIRYTLSRAGFPSISRLSGYGARERVIVMESLKMADLKFTTEFANGNNLAFQIAGTWFGLPPSDVKKVQQKFSEVVMVAKKFEHKDGFRGNRLQFGGSVTAEDGTVTPGPTVVVEIDNKGLDKFLDADFDAISFLFKWAKSDIATKGPQGKGWAYNLGPKIRPRAGGVEGEFEVE